MARKTMLDAAIKVNVSINSMLSRDQISTQDLLKLMATGINILLYDRIEQWTRELQHGEGEKKSEISP